MSEISRLGVAVSVDKWYDRHSRSWIVQKKDANGHQVGPAHYSGTKRGAEICADDWSKELQQF